MTELRLLHLTYAGMGRETASVVFDPRLTIVYGASDTGKSFVTESIDYMLGARKLSLIPEAAGYSQILLGIALPDASVITLMRAPESGRVSVFDDDVRDLVYRSPDLVLSAQHSPRTTRNLSRYLMERIGLDGALLATNDAGATKLAGFRDLLHLCLISETRMVSKVSPVLRTSGTSGQTAHKSALKLLLTGAGEQPSPSGLNQAQRRVHKGKISLLDELILGLQRQLASREANQSQLQQQLRLLLEHQDTRAQSLRDVTRRHAQAASDRATLSVALARYAQRLAETDDLLGRFELLRAQYESDLARLGMVSEAGSLLGYFRSGPCVFCGAEPHHQQAGHDAMETTALHQAVTAESTKTRTLLADLLVTIEDLRSQRAYVAEDHAVHAAQAEQADAEIARIEREELSPLQDEVAEVMATRSRLENELGLHARIEELEDVRAQLVSEEAQPGGQPSRGIPAATLTGFDRAIERTLDAWRVRREEVTYDQHTAELYVGERSRSGHGKGMRAVLHAAFTTALADYGLEHRRSHPGFIVLDSPLVTFREPGVRETDLRQSVPEHFYRHLLSTFRGQAIVVENTDPPADVLDQGQVYMFSREAHGQRFGFFPLTSSSLPMQ
ncbi:hypothetical protein [Streptomyces griseorubiginosus]|uniref:hypothetical protein n=1 Tax=Streptomyces griseorubiginosus TaxID=67304 RepID=UPI0011408001|nr:hypothetical protein [Streptomyces griseorubiginosus]